MPSFNDPRSIAPRQDKPTPSLGLLSAENQSTEPLPVPGKSAMVDPEAIETHILPAQPSSVITRQLALQANPSVTRQLTSTLTDSPEGSSKRTPLRIQGQRKQATASAPTRHLKRRLNIVLASILSLFLIFCITLLTATPIGRDLNQNFNPLQTGKINMINNSNGNPQLIAQATATAVYYQQTDGYDPSAYGGGQLEGDGSSSLSWPLGQCTYWANERYHQLTGYWVNWTGNADEWVDGAKAAGWSISTIPHVPSIIVLMPYVQGASSYGHVAVVESIATPATPTATPTPTTVVTSNMNWWANGGGWDKVSDVNFTVGQGVYFIWHP